METSLHRELKRLYAGSAGRTEARVGRFRIDAIVETDGEPELIEIQLAPLSAIRDKVRRLCRRHRVRVVKPIIGTKRLVKRALAGGSVVDRRQSPYRGSLVDVFHELVYFTQAFPHGNLTVEAILVDVEEWRVPRKNRRRWRRRQHVVEDQKLLEIRDRIQLCEAGDLRQLIACELPTPFRSAHLAAGLEIDRWVAQRIAYVLRKCGAAETVGRDRGGWCYRWNEVAELRRAA